MSTLAQRRIYVAALCIVSLALVPVIPSPAHAAPPADLLPRLSAPGQRWPD